MNRLTLLIIAMMMTVLNSIGAEQSPSQRPLYFDVHSNREVSKRPRAPQKISVEAFYNADDNTITIVSNPTINGTSYLSYNGSIIMSSETVNVSFILPYSEGNYEVAIQTEEWIAYASLVL